MPPLLHPKSRMTSSLFATTVAACFLVVTIPHLLPCPVPRARFADGDVMVDENGRRMRWKRKDANPKVEDGIAQFNDVASDEAENAQDRARRECPLPKPGGMLGEWLGFHKSDKETGR
ncbi:alpha-1,3-mannosyltransferase (Alg3) [Fusarium circinatum]|uniref:Alpha-1,3-mannosyltransferase (Alg3) n=1 Tax=Fusarium circinatum TaxID=48490 RepID=A0A8H5U3I7_FUSCI|nr:alpha-1,3-mannosyltransferase (Alg3) [Fusarium circinatum]